MSFVSYSQNMEDVLLWRALRQVEAGFYIDVGAADPEIDSVTRAFYDRGWSGINVEPMGEYFQRLMDQRARDQNICAVIGETPGIARLNAIPGTGLSTLNDSVAEKHRAAGWEPQIAFVPRLTLTSLMEERGEAPIHFLKIDVEGAERAVLEGADLQRFRPWVIVMEATAPNSPEDTRSEWEDLLISQRYALAIFDGLNCFYVAEEHAELTERFSVPANVFDDYVRASEQHSVNALANAQADAAQQREQVAVAQTKHAEAMAHLQAENQMLRNELAAAAVKFEEERMATLDRQRAEAAFALQEERAQNTLKIEALMREQNAADYARARLTDVQRRAEAADADQRSLRIALVDVRRRHADLLRRFATMHEQNYTLRDDYKDLHAHYAALHETATLISNRLQATLTSHSWRLMGIVRTASRLVRRRPRAPASLTLAGHAVPRLRDFPLQPPPDALQEIKEDVPSGMTRSSSMLLRRLVARGLIGSPS